MDEKVPDTSYGQMVDEQVNNFRVMTDAYRGEKVFQDELKRIFYRSWIFVCHESQISEPGDFKSVVVGTQPVIVSRDMSGEIHAVLNACTHRGATLVREETGTARNFVCPYHGWAFKSSGELLAISDPSRYPPDFDRSDKHLKRLRVETYGGLVFVSFNSKVEPLLDFLGGTVPHIDLWNKRTAGRKYRLGMPHRYVYAGNWKFQSENVYDGYHPGYVHRSAFETIRKFAGSFEGRYYGAVRQQGFTRGYPGGHGTLEAGTPLESGNVDPALRQGYLAELVSLNGEDVASKILLNRHIFIFPNLAVNDFNLRVIQPIAHDRTESYSHPLFVEGLHDDLNASRVLDAQTRVGSAGILSADDTEVFAGNQNALKALGNEWFTLSRGLGLEEVKPDGERVGTYSDEAPQRAFWRKWVSLMSQEVLA
jgi:nitrite reductase/ring-hydroxylating ferredoxin subunit